MEEHSQKLKKYLQNKINELEKQIKKSKRNNIIIQAVYGSLITTSIISATTICVISSVGFPVIAITIVSAVSAISTALSIKFNLKNKKLKLSKDIKKLNMLKDKLEYIVALNGNLSSEECNIILKEFRDI